MTIPDPKGGPSIAIGVRADRFRMMSTRAPRRAGDRPVPEGMMQEARRIAAANKAAVARNLARLYDEVLEAPLPEDLTALVQRLEAKEREQR